MEQINKLENITSEIYKILRECVKFENIENDITISKYLVQLFYYVDDIPNDLFIQIVTFVKDNFMPLVFDVDYFEFLYDEQFGEFAEGEDGDVFVINSERSRDTMMYLKYQTVFEFVEKIDQFANEYLQIDKTKKLN